MATESVLQTCTDSLKRVQTFNAQTLSREDDLGKQMSFVDAVKHAEAIIALYKRIPLSAIPDFSDTQLNVIQGQANADFSTFKQILEFNAASGDVGTRTNLLDALKVRRDQLFDAVWQYVAYSVARATDTSLLETQARATIQAIENQAGVLTGNLNQSKKDADEALAAIRAVAAEQGVSQKAVYFKTESDDQEKSAASWLTRTYVFAGALGIFAVFSLFLHKIDLIKPANEIESFQLISSKILIFAVLGFLLVMAARNYVSHKHNSIVNRHRQNALLTYQALVKASAGQGTEDIVLANAASCIFSPQESGFSQGRGDGSSGSKSVLELFTKGTNKTSE